MFMTSLRTWLQAFLLSLGTTVFMAVVVGLLHLHLGSRDDEPKNGIAICDFLINEPQQFAVAMIRSSDQELPYRQRSYLVALNPSSPQTGVRIGYELPEPTSVASGPLGKLIVAAMDGAVYVIDPSDINCPAIIAHLNEPAFQLVCSPDGSRLITVESKQMCVWDTASCEMQWRMGANSVCSVALLPDSDSIVCGMADGRVKELSLSTGKELADIAKHETAVMSLAVSPRGETVASFCGRQIYVTNRRTGALVWQRRADKGLLPLLKFSRDGQRLITGEFAGRDWTIQVWNLEGNRVRRIFVEQCGPLVGAEVLPGEQLLTWSADGRLSRWSLTDSRLLEVTLPSWPRDSHPGPNSIAAMRLPR